MSRRVVLLMSCVYVGLALVAFLALRVWVPVRVSGGSMYPALRSGDLVLVRMGRRPEIGGIALVQPLGRRPVLHRVVGRDEEGRVKTRGDANPTADAVALTGREVKGTVVRVLPVGVLVERWRGAAAYDTLSVQSNSTR